MTCKIIEGVHDVREDTTNRQALRVDPASTAGLDGPFIIGTRSGLWLALPSPFD